MTTRLKPLRECVLTFRDRVARNYETATTDKLFDVILHCHSKLLSEREDCKRVDQIRAVSWFVNAELTRRGVSPRSRRCLGAIPTKSKKLLDDIKKQDAPYLDLQWLAFRYPDSLPKRWSDVRMLNATAPGTLTTSSEPIVCDDEIVFDLHDRDVLLNRAFNHADRLIERRISIARLCRELKLNYAAQSEMRWLCSRQVKQLLCELDIQSDELRIAMRRQGIKQLTPDLIESRIQMIRAWKLAGGGTKWQAAADVLAAMTGVTISRQAVREMIIRLGEQKIIRKPRGKRRKVEPILKG